jgi:hypothetical protein
MVAPEDFLLTKEQIDAKYPGGSPDYPTHHRSCECSGCHASWTEWRGGHAAVQVVRPLLTQLETRLADAELQKVIEAAREATCDTHHIPACVELGKALHEYDKARGALCPVCDGAGSIDDDECDRGEGPMCEGPCGGTGLVEPVTVTQTGA